MKILFIELDLIKFFPVVDFIKIFF
jgi:hypothetical protein